MTRIHRVKKDDEKNGSGKLTPKRADDVNAMRNPRHFGALKTRVQTELFAKLDPSFNDHSPAEVRTKIEEIFEVIFTNVLNEENIVLSNLQRIQLLESSVMVILGFGPLTALMADDDVIEIMVNSPKEVYVNRKGRMVRAAVSFDNEAHLLRVLNRLLEPVGEHIDSTHPIVKARFPDGSSLHAITHPLAYFGTTITFQKYSKLPLTIQDLIRFDSLTNQAAEFLRACVYARLNIVVSGGSKSGKTALLNALSNFIPDDYRIITIETMPELQLGEKHVISLISRPLDNQGHGEISISDLISNALQMRPDHIIVGECRSGEALDLVQAMYLYNDCMTTVQSSGSRDTLDRLEVMCLMSGTAVPVHIIRKIIASSINVIVHLKRLQDGSRKVVKVTEIQGIDGEVITLSDIFEFEQTGIEAGKVLGSLHPTGVRPKCLDHIEASGIHLQPSVFDVGSNPTVDS